MADNEIGEPEGSRFIDSTTIAAHEHELRDQLKQARDAVMRKL